MPVRRTDGVHRFIARLERRDVPGTTTFVRVPPDVMAAFAPRKRVPVVAAIDACTWRTTIVPYGEQFFVPVRAEIRERAGVASGDEVVVEIRPDVAPREAKIPPDLAAALAAAGAGDAFAAFAYSHQSEFIRWIDEAKRPKTRGARIEKTVERTKHSPKVRVSRTSVRRAR